MSLRSQRVKDFIALFGRPIWLRMMLSSLAMIDFFIFNIADDVVCIVYTSKCPSCNKRIVMKWSSRTVLKTSSADIKRMFCDLEKLYMKLVSLKSHRKFNEICLNTHIYTLYTYIWERFTIKLMGRDAPCVCTSYVCSSIHWGRCWIFYSASASISPVWGALSDGV